MVSIQHLSSSQLAEAASPDPRFDWLHRHPNPAVERVFVRFNIRRVVGRALVSLCLPLAIVPNQIIHNAHYPADHAINDFCSDPRILLRFIALPVVVTAAAGAIVFVAPALTRHLPPSAAAANLRAAATSHRAVVVAELLAAASGVLFDGLRLLPGPGYFPAEVPLLYLVTRPRLAHAPWIVPALVVLALLSDLLFSRPLGVPGVGAVRAAATLLIYAAAVAFVGVSERLERRSFSFAAAQHVAVQLLSSRIAAVDRLAVATVPPLALGRVRDAVLGREEHVRPDWAHRGAACVVQVAGFAAWTQGRLFPRTFSAVHRLLSALDAVARSHHGAHRITFGFDRGVFVAGVDPGGGADVTGPGAPAVLEQFATDAVARCWLDDGAADVLRLCASVAAGPVAAGTVGSAPALRVVAVGPAVDDAVRGLHLVAAGQLRTADGAVRACGDPPLAARRSRPTASPPVGGTGAASRDDCEMQSIAELPGHSPVATGRAAEHRVDRVRAAGGECTALASAVTDRIATEIQARFHVHSVTLSCPAAADSRRVLARTLLSEPVVIGVSCCVVAALIAVWVAAQFIQFRVITKIQRNSDGPYPAIAHDDDAIELFFDASCNTDSAFAALPAVVCLLCRGAMWLVMSRRTRRLPDDDRSGSGGTPQPPGDALPAVSLCFVLADCLLLTLTFVGFVLGASMFLDSIAALVVIITFRASSGLRFWPLLLVAVLPLSVFASWESVSSPGQKLIMGLCNVIMLSVMHWSNVHASRSAAAMLCAAEAALAEVSDRYHVQLTLIGSLLPRHAIKPTAEMLASRAVDAASCAPVILPQPASHLTVVCGRLRPFHEPPAATGASATAASVELDPRPALRQRSSSITCLSAALTNGAGELLDLVSVDGDTWIAAGPFREVAEEGCAAECDAAAVAALRFAAAARRESSVIVLTHGEASTVHVGAPQISCRMVGPVAREAFALLEAVPTTFDVGPSNAAAANLVAGPPSDPASSRCAVLAAPAYRKKFRGAIATVAIDVAALEADEGDGLCASLGMSTAARSVRLMHGALPVEDDVGPQGDTVFTAPLRWRVRGVGVIGISAVRAEALAEATSV